jgi:hypothetical protein
MSNVETKTLRTFVNESHSLQTQSHSLYTTMSNLHILVLIYFSIVFWFGDLNYRVDMDDSEVRKKSKEGDYEKLLTGDQLKLSIRTKAAFTEYVEGPIQFPPTYKYEIGTSTFEDYEPKHRTPAYTDRILWREHPKFSSNKSEVDFS